LTTITTSTSELADAKTKVRTDIPVAMATHRTNDRFGKAQEELLLRDTAFHSCSEGQQPICHIPLLRAAPLPAPAVCNNAPALMSTELKPILEQHEDREARAAVMMVILLPPSLPRTLPPHQTFLLVLALTHPLTVEHRHPPSLRACWLPLGLMLLACSLLAPCSWIEARERRAKGKTVVA